MTSVANPVDDDVANVLRSLAEAASPSIVADPGLAGVVLRRTRRARRVHRAVGATGVGLAVIAAVAAASSPSKTYFTVTEPSASMQPTINVGEQVLFNRTLSPQSGDIVQVHVTRNGSNFDAIFRVAGLPGDTVSCPAGPTGGCTSVLVNGQPLPTPYPNPTDAFATQNVPAGSLFLLGDNRGDANDSRLIGDIPVSDVIGVAVSTDRGGRRLPVPDAPAHHIPGDKGNITGQPIPPAPAGGH